MIAYTGLRIMAICALALTAGGGLLSAGRTEELPLLVGGSAHGSKFIDALAELGLGNFVWIPKTGDPTSPAPWDKQNDLLADTEACKRNGMYFLVSQRRGLGRSYKPGGNEYGGDTSTELHNAATIRKVADRAGKLFVGLQAEEMDADLLQSALRISSRTRIPEIYKFTDRAGGRRCFEAELSRIAKIYHKYAPGVNFWPNMCVTMQHSGFRTGDVVIAEFLESLPTTELQLAYLRGGGRQFGKDWGMWVSPWYQGKVPSEDEKLWKGYWLGVGEGHTASAFRRCLYLSYGSGARVLTAQQTEPLISGREGGGFKLAAWGNELKSFWDYAKRHTERMDPIIPIALLVDKNNGWAPGHLHGDWLNDETIWGKLPIDRSDKMLSAYLNVLLPDFERNAPNWWQTKGVTYPGYFASTPIGAFDIVASDISAEKLSHYPAVVLMGDTDMDAGLLDALKAYVKQGGNLYINTNQLRRREEFVQDPEFLGCAIGMSHMWSAWSGSDLNMRKATVATKIVRKLPLPGVSATEMLDPWYAAQDVQPKTAEVAADDGAGNPILLRNSYGKGWVYLSTPEYMMEGFGGFKLPLGFFKSLILGLAHAGPVEVFAPGSEAAQADISWVASYQGADSVIIVLANHGKEDRPVEVVWRRPCANGAIEVGKGATGVRKSGRSTVFAFSIAPEDVTVLRIHGVARDRP